MKPKKYMRQNAKGEFVFKPGETKCVCCSEPASDVYMQTREMLIVPLVPITYVSSKSHPIALCPRHAKEYRSRRIKFMLKRFGYLIFGLSLLALAPTINNTIVSTMVGCLGLAGVVAFFLSVLAPSDPIPESERTPAKKPILENKDTNARNQSPAS